MKKHLALLAATTAVSSLSAHAVLVAGWDTWTSTTALNYDATVVNSATGLAVGTPATAGAIGHFNNSAVGFGASTDGTWGGITDSVSPTVAAADQFAAVGVTNTRNGSFDFTVTADGGQILFTSFNFDALRRFGGSANTWTLSVESGAITNGLVASGAIAQDNSNANAAATLPAFDFDVLLSTLADRTLEDGESAVFRLALTGGAEDGGGGNNALIDNVGVFGDVTSIPEPSSSLLALLGGIFLIRRRR